MICKNCGNEVQDGINVCPMCGAPVIQEANSYANNQNVYQPPVAHAPYAPAPQAPAYTNAIPENYRPLSPWAYLGYSLLFSIPLVGFILLIVFSVSDANINRRNYARMYWCSFLVCLIIGVVVGIVFGILAALGVVGIGGAAAYGF